MNIFNEQELRMSFGLRIRRIREGKGLTLLDLEISTGISEGALSKIENGKKNITLPTVFKIALGLGVSPEELVTGLDSVVEEK